MNFIDDIDVTLLLVWRKQIVVVDVGEIEQSNYKKGKEINKLIGGIILSLIFYAILFPSP